MTQEKLTEIFGRFVGMEVPLGGGSVRRGGRIRANYTPIDENHPVLKDMEQAAAQNGLTLRVWWPGKFGAVIPRDEKRVNAYIDCESGAWRISDRFVIG